MHERSVPPEKERDLYVCVCLRERETARQRGEKRDAKGTEGCQYILKLN